MDIEEIRRMNVEELNSTLERLRDEKANIRVQSAFAPIDNPMRIRDIRKDVARIKTVLNEREAEINND